MRKFCAFGENLAEMITAQFDHPHVFIPAMEEAGQLDLISLPYSGEDRVLQSEILRKLSATLTKGFPLVPKNLRN
jgi:pyrroloquinoline quinone (PQQ) biosynthesis protein C